MPPRRSVRAASTKPVSTLADTKYKSETRPSSQPVKMKRDASTVAENNQPPAKRAKPSTPAVTATKKSLSRSSTPAVGNKLSSKKPTTKRLAAVNEDVPQIPYFNPLPEPLPHSRPPNQLFVWGAGNFGQFGLGPDDTEEFNKPKKNKWFAQQLEEGRFGGENAGLEAVAGGGLFSLFIDESGTVWSFGTNDDAALGRITAALQDPDKPDKLLDEDNLTYYPHPIQSLRNEKFRAVRIAAGDSIGVAVSSEGDLRAWGTIRGNEGVLGFSEGVRHQFLPASILQLPQKPGDAEKVVSVAAGNNHVLILTTHGNVYTFGTAEQGQLGRKVLERRKIHGTSPEKVILGARGRKAVAIGAGNYTSFAVDDQGNVWGWGLNSVLQTGTSDSMIEDVHVPTKVLGLSQEELKGDKIVAISGGEQHTLFLSHTGKVYACGRASDGQLGLATDHKTFKNPDHLLQIGEPVLVPFPNPADPVVQVSVGTQSNLAITRAGIMYSWGDCSQSELGAGDTGNLRTPTLIVGNPTGKWEVTAASLGGQHGLAMLKMKT